MASLYAPLAAKASDFLSALMTGLSTRILLENSVRCFILKYMNDKALPYFDTLAAAEELKKAGASDKLAKAIVHILGDAQSLLATRRDLRLMELRLFLYVLTANGAVIAFLLNLLG